LSIQQIEHARRTVLDNGLDLIRDAELLFSSARYPRAFALAHLACEEFAKLPMLVRAGGELAAGVKVDWAKLTKRLSSHAHKLNSINISEYALSPLRGKGTVRKFFDALAGSKRQNALKNACLYSDLVGDSFKKPSDLITEADAKACIERARQLAEWFAKVEEVTRGKLASVVGSSDWKTFGERVQRIIANKDVTEALTSLMVGANLLQNALGDRKRQL
jgi:AbiV family abortive infection protein